MRSKYIIHHKTRHLTSGRKSCSSCAAIRIRISPTSRKLLWCTRGLLALEGLGRGQLGAHGGAARLLRHMSDPKLCASVPAVPEGGKPPGPGTNELFPSISSISALKHQLRATVAVRLTVKTFS